MHPAVYQLPKIFKNFLLLSTFFFFFQFPFAFFFICLEMFLILEKKKKKVEDNTFKDLSKAKKAASA